MLRHAGHGVVVFGAQCKFVWIRSCIVVSRETWGAGCLSFRIICFVPVSLDEVELVIHDGALCTLHG